MGGGASSYNQGVSSGIVGGETRKGEVNSRGFGQVICQAQRLSCVVLIHYLCERK